MVRQVLDAVVPSKHIYQRGKLVYNQEFQRFANKKGLDSTNKLSVSSSVTWKRK
jgi:hypothetical protein